MFCFLEINELAEHGTFLPINMQGLTDEQIEELKLKDEWEEKCVPSGGFEFKKDEIGRRNGRGKIMMVSNIHYYLGFCYCIRLRLEDFSICSTVGKDNFRK